MIGDVDLSKYDNGIIEVMKEILLVGTKSIDEFTLLDNDFDIGSKSPNLALRNFYNYSICYKRVVCKYLKNCVNYRHGECTTYFDFMALARRTK